MDVRFSDIHELEGEECFKSLFTDSKTSIARLFECICAFEKNFNDACKVDGEVRESLSEEAICNLHHYYDRIFGCTFEGSSVEFADSANRYILNLCKIAALHAEFEKSAIYY